MIRIFAIILVLSPGMAKAETIWAFFRKFP